MYLGHEVVAQGESASPTTTEMALDGLDLVYSFIYSRVGNRADAEDLTQQVALKALPRLRDGSPATAVRGYLFATARSVMAAFWSRRCRVPESELAADVADDGRGKAPEASRQTAAWLEQTLAALPAHYRQVLELRFLREFSLREVAGEMGKSVGAIKLMQLRALRAAAAAMPASAPSTTASRCRPARRQPAGAPGLACAPRPAGRVS